MALIFADRVKESTLTTGTGAMALAGVVPGFQTFTDGIGAANTCYYCIITGDDQWEVGTGTFTTGPDTLSRDTVHASSNSDALIVLPAGSKEVFVTNPAFNIDLHLLNVVEDSTPQLGGDLDSNGFTITGLKAPLVVNNQTGVAYTAILSDAESMITMDNAAANVVTIPANASVAYPVGTKLNFSQLGAGTTSIAITTDTLNVESTLTLVLNGSYAVATAVKLTSTEWVLFGNLAVA